MIIKRQIDPLLPSLLTFSDTDIHNLYNSQQQVDAIIPPTAPTSPGNDRYYSTKPATFFPCALGSRTHCP
ncbi:hypothetical protein E2C01_038726 [Portunus trituberculatus]|uniref:Uncharacterized protein n=1 Tax=Portunus trituberculatus TaxID=210409 RepID=A0A5B7FIT2_PORTR|nr:hypothetical protein [Portunus trituberculatus]